MYKTLTYFILIFITVTLHAFSNAAGQNMIMIGVMAACALVCVCRAGRIEKNDLLLVALLLLMFASARLNPKSFRLSTVLYSGMFIGQFIAYKMLVKHCLSLRDYRRVLCGIFYAFFAVLLMQQAAELVHLPGFNRFGLFDNRFKMNSLAQEPSALPPTLILLLYSVTRADNLTEGREMPFSWHLKRNRRLWLMFFYMIFTCGSTTGIFITPVFLLYFFRKKLFSHIPAICLCAAAGYWLFGLLSPETTERFSRVTAALVTFDPMAVYAADPSASARIAPYLFYAADIDLTDLRFWLGKGIDYAANHLSLMLRGFEDDSSAGIGGLTNFAYDYGFAAFALLLLYLRKNVFGRFRSYEFVLWLLIYSVQSFNVSLFWAPLILMHTNLFFAKKYGQANLNRNSDLQRVQDPEAVLGQHRPATDGGV